MTRNYQELAEDCLRRLRLHEKEANRLRDENHSLRQQINDLKLELQELQE